MIKRVYFWLRNLVDDFMAIGVAREQEYAQTLNQLLLESRSQHGGFTPDDC